MALAGWYYNKDITIQGSSGAGTDYQVLLKVGESSGSSGCDFHLDGHSAKFPSDKNDGGDLRFYDGSDNLLPFWVEKVEGTTPNRVAYVWVKVSADLSSDQTIRCYYGNPNAENVSNIADTALNGLGDDFEGSSLNTNNWSEHYLEGSAGGSVSVANSELTVQQIHQGINASYQVYSNISFLNKAIRTKVKMPDYTATAGRDRGDWTGFSESTAFENNAVEIGAWESGSNANAKYRTINSGTATDLNVTPNPTDYHTYDLKWGSSTCKFCYDDNYDNDTTNIPTENLPVSIISRTWGYSYDVRTVVDWVFVRKYADPEPSFKSAGAEVYHVSKLSGTVCDKNGNPITGVVVDIAFLKKDTKELLHTCQSNSNDGTWVDDQIPIDPNTKVLAVFSLEGSYNGDTDIAGAEFTTTEQT